MGGDTVQGWVLALAIGLMLLGLVGTMVPALPGVPIIFLAILGYGWYEGFHQVSGHYLALMGALALLSVAVDYGAGFLGSRSLGATRLGSVGAAIGGIVLTILWGPVGIIVGPWIGAFTGEILAGKNLVEAARAGWGALIGILSGTLANLIISLIMIISFLVVVLPIV